jgi:hypothetical protein
MTIEIPITRQLIRGVQKMLSQMLKAGEDLEYDFVSHVSEEAKTALDVCNRAMKCAHSAGQITIDWTRLSKHEKKVFQHAVQTYVSSKVC